MLQNPKTQNATILKTEILTKLKYSYSNKTKKLKSITTFQIKTKKATKLKW